MKKRILEMCNRLDILERIGKDNVAVSGLSIDSRTTQKDELYIALNGYNTDGHKFIDQAIINGAIAVICEKLPEIINNKVEYIRVKDTRNIMGLIADDYYDNPSSKLKVVGVTGTNGKTTITTVLYELLEKMGYKTGLISTVRNLIHEKELVSTHTTPDPIQINFLMSEMVNAGCEYCFLELSSHAIEQKRISGINFIGGIFSNITQDHLDYHHSFKEYLGVKKSFFDKLPISAFVLCNSDDKNSKIIIQNTKAIKKTYSVRSYSDFKCKIIESNFNSMYLEFDGTSMWTPFIGDFNASNLTAVYACSRILGFEKEEILKNLSGITSIKGRCEYLKLQNGITGIVDYAHTPDALMNILETISKIKKGDERLITVVGAGGDRDKAKRPKMGKIAALLSDKLILTSDNPRSEDPEKIIEEMYSGIVIKDKKKVIKITDRREAIKIALNMANENDIILVAGKGHEKYQEIKGIRKHFDDLEILSEFGMLN